MSRTVIVNARLLDPESGLDATGAVVIENGAIADVIRGAAPVIAGAEAIDAAGACVAPGLIDMRVHAREPGEEHKETIATAARAAVAGGVTTMACLPDTRPAIDNPALVGFVRERGRAAALARVETYAAVSQGLGGEKLAEMGLLREAGAVAFTDGTRCIADAVLMRRALTYARAFGALVVQRPEEPSLSQGEMHEGELSARLGLAGIPAAAEAIVLERDMRLVELTGGRYHAGPLCTAEGVEVIRKAKARGLAVTCDTAPHYFALNETAIGEYRTFARVAPPLRSEEDRRAIVAGLADGTIDAIASDHAPQDSESKRLPFGQAEPGIIGLETLLPLTLELVHNLQLGMLAALRALTLAPAGILGLPGGRLARGAPADLVIFDPDAPWKIAEAAFHSIAKNSPFDGRPVQGRALRTLVGGRTVHLFGA